MKRSAIELRVSLVKVFVPPSDCLDFQWREVCLASNLHQSQDIGFQHNPGTEQSFGISNANFYPYFVFGDLRLRALSQ